MAQFDVVVIGAGPGGYVAAIRAAQLGFKVACVDEFSGKNSNEASLGGTCLNVGCIPSKSLLHSSEIFYCIQEEFPSHGISVGKPKIDIPTMIERKDKIVQKLTSGIAFLFKQNKITSIYGHAAFKGKKEGLIELEVTPKNKKEKPEILQAKQVIIATGSKPRALPGTPFDNKKILDNEGALDLTAVPKKLCLVGSGIIGLEMGAVWKRLGAEVTILEAETTFLPQVDQQLAKEALRIFSKSPGLDIHLGTKVKDINTESKQLIVRYEEEGKSHTADFDKLIVAIGRTPYTEKLNLEAIGLKTDDRGFIEVDENCRTVVDNVWAIGDVVRGPMLAHKAEAEGAAVAERIAGQKPQVHLQFIPSVLYTSPALAWVGKTEEQLKKEGVKYKKGMATFASNGQALALNQGQGKIKILADAQTDRLLGVHILGPLAAELLSEAVEALEYSASSEDIARIIHAHPSLSEVMKEACAAAWEA